MKCRDSFSGLDAHPKKGNKLLDSTTPTDYRPDWGWLSSFPSFDQRPIDHLASALFVNAPNPRARLMAMFTAYFDASGNAQDQPFVVVSGYIASYIQWKSFEAAWGEIHNKYGFQIPFHATEFMAARNNPGKYAKQRKARQDYKTIAGRISNADEFLMRLSHMQSLFVNCAITAIVPMSTYDGVSSLLELRKVVPPYALGARLCIEMVRQWEKLFDVPMPVECIFEEGDFEQGKFTRLMVDEGAPVPIYKKAEDFAGLQGADHYAWERASMSRLLANASADPPPTMAFQFLGAIPKLHMETTTTNLVNICHLKKIDPKTGVQH